MNLREFDWRPHGGSNRGFSREGANGRRDRRSPALGSNGRPNGRVNLVNIGLRTLFHPLTSAGILAKQRERENYVVACTCLKACPTPKAGRTDALLIIPISRGEVVVDHGGIGLPGPEAACIESRHIGLNSHPVDGATASTFELHLA